MKKFIIVFAMLITATAFSQPYTLLDSLQRTNDSLRARIATLEANSPSLDTTVTVNVTSPGYNGKYILFDATKNIQITSITDVSATGTSISDIQFALWYGDTPFTSGTLLKFVDYYPGGPDDFYITSNNTVVKNQVVWIGFEEYDAVLLSSLKFKINYHRL